MMRVPIIVFVLCVTLHTAAMAQNWLAEGQSGIGAYEMRDLKNYPASYPPGSYTTTLQNFPPYWFFRGRVSYKVLPDWRIGLAYGFMSTGARSDYQDYSGQIRFDQVVHSNSVGVVNCYELNLSKRITVSNQVTVWRTASGLKMDQTFRLAGSPTQEFSYNYKSSSFMVEYNLVGYYSARNMKFGCFLGYNRDLEGKLKSGGSTSSAKTDWSGIRTGISIGFAF